MLSGLQVTRLWPYGGPGQNYGSFGGKATQVFVPKRNTGAGKAKKRRRYEIEVDGEVFDVDSPEEAKAVLAQLKEQAKQVAEVATERAQKRSAPVGKVMRDARKALPLPDIKTPDLPDFHKIAMQMLGEINDLFNETLKTIEIAALMRQKALRDEEDDEDVLMLL